MYSRHRGGDFGTAFVFGFGLLAAWLIFRFALLAVIVLSAIIWAVSANWHLIPRWVVRILFVLAMVIALMILIVLLSDGGTP